MPTSPREPIEAALERLSLCTLTVQQAHYELEAPTNPEEKADLLLAVEGLTYEVLDLLKTTKSYVWGLDDEDHPTEE
jgi:hypothetical protein